MNLTRSQNRCCAVILALAGAAVLLAGCGLPGSAEGDGRNGSGKTKVVTTVAMIADIVRQVAGEKAEVVSLMGENVDPHTYSATRNDVKELRSADVVFYNGLFLEGRMEQVLEQLAESGRPVFAVTDAIERSLLRKPPEFEGHYDPHVWMDADLWSRCVDFVAEKLAGFDPDNAELFRANAKEYKAKLAGLHEYCREVIGTVPEGKRWLVTAHDAFGYFARAYGLQVRSVLGLSTESKAGLDDIRTLVNFIVENEIPAVFIETSVNPKGINKVIEDCRARGWNVRIGGKLFSDAMGRPGTYEGTYVGMIDHNATVIARALGGEAPRRGMTNDETPNDEGMMKSQ